MDRPSRPPSRPDGLGAGTASVESGGDPPTAGAAGDSRQTFHTGGGSERRSGQPEPRGGGETEPRCRPRTVSPLEGLGVFHTRSIFYFSRRSSSGYFSSDSDSLPSSPLSTTPAPVDRAAQTPSPSGQARNHALRRTAEARRRRRRRRHRRRHGSQLSPSSAQQQNAAGDMQAVEVGRELRRVGDDFNNHLVEAAGRNRRGAIQPARGPRIHQEPIVLLCVGLLLFVIGRIIYLQGCTNVHGHSQV